MIGRKILAVLLLILALLGFVGIIGIWTTAGFGSQLISVLLITGCLIEESIFQFQFSPNTHILPFKYKMLSILWDLLLVFVLIIILSFIVAAINYDPSIGYRLGQWAPALLIAGYKFFVILYRNKKMPEDDVRDNKSDFKESNSSTMEDVNLD